VEAKDWTSVFAMEKPVLYSKPKEIVDAETTNSAMDAESVEEVCKPLFIIMIFIFKSLNLFQKPKEVVKSDEMLVEELQGEVSDLMSQIETIQEEVKTSKTKITEVSVTLF